MKRARLGLATAALLAAVTSKSPAAAQDADPWFGPDKASHFAVSAGIAAGGYTIGAALFDARGHALIFGGALAVAAGAGKEVYDLTGAGSASWKDLAWDAMGTATGLAVAWGIDLLVRGVSEKRPLFTAPRVESAGAGLGLRLGF